MSTIGEGLDVVHAEHLLVRRVAAVPAPKAVTPQYAKTKVRWDRDTLALRKVIMIAAAVTTEACGLPLRVVWIPARFTVTLWHDCDSSTR